MLARAANLVLEEAQTQRRMDALSHMLENHGDDDLQLHTEEDIATTFANLLRELQEKFFELDSKSQTVKQYLGESAKQDSETVDLVGKNKVPRGVYLYLRFLSAREIQRKRNYLYSQNLPAPTVRRWKQYLRDDTRRRVRSYLLGQPSSCGRKARRRMQRPSSQDQCDAKEKGCSKRAWRKSEPDFSKAKEAETCCRFIFKEARSFTLRSS